MSNLVEHAKAELKRAGYAPDMEDDMERVIYQSTIKIVEAFSQCGHSGMSAMIHTDMIRRLLSFEPLGTITNDPDEWMEISEEMMGEPGVYQNRRDGRMFSEDAGLTYHNVDEQRYGWKATLFGRWKKIYTSAEAQK